MLRLRKPSSLRNSNHLWQDDAEARDPWKAFLAWPSTGDVDDVDQRRDSFIHTWGLSSSVVSALEILCLSSGRKVGAAGSHIEGPSQRDADRAIVRNRVIVHLSII